MATETPRQIKALFVGLGNSRVAWYRCFLPALYLGADWMGVVGEPPALRFVTGYVQGKTQLANFSDYDVVILQQPRGRGWFQLIQGLRAQGIVVLYEIDDYVHGIRKAKDHDFSHFFGKSDLASMELCMHACDAMICSTEYLSRRYSARTVGGAFVCENGLDMGRYRLSTPTRGKIDGRETVTIMWSGATGHTRGVDPWIGAIERVMDEHSHVCFASIGQDFSARLAHFSERVIAIPFAALETYPSAMMLGDIAVAPAGDTSWYRGKSDLRAMETAALGIPVIADRHYHNAVIDGHTGFTVQHAGEALAHLTRLVEDPELRREMGANARLYAQEHFDMSVRRESWRKAVIAAWEEAREHVGVAK